MEVNKVAEIKDGGVTLSCAVAAPSQGTLQKQKSDEGTAVKKKRRRGKSKRKLLKPFMKIPWQNRRRNDKSKRNNGFRKLVVTKSHAPYNNNQFLMEIHKPEPDGNFNLRTPARTRDSSFSVDSEENYFYSLPEDEEDFLTKEFSSVYEDAQSERLASMTKNELIQEYLVLEAKYENLIKRTDETYSDDEKDSTMTDRDTSCTDKDSSLGDKDQNCDKSMSDISLELKVSQDPAMIEILRRLREQEEQIHELKIANEKLKSENEKLHKRQYSSSEDSESDSSSTSFSCSSSSSRNSPHVEIQPMDDVSTETLNHNGINGNSSVNNPEHSPLVNGLDYSEASQ